MPDYMIILIILLLALIGSCIKWMAKDVARMRREENEIEHWLANGEKNNGK